MLIAALLILALAGSPQGEWPRQGHLLLLTLSCLVAGAALRSLFGFPPARVMPSCDSARIEPDRGRRRCQESVLAGVRADLAVSQAAVRTESAGRILALQQLRHADKLKTVGRLAASVAHELGTPLTVISGRAAMICELDLDERERVHSAEVIRKQASQISDTIRQLLDFSRLEPARVEPIELGELITHTGKLLTSEAHDQGMVLRALVGPAGLVVQGDRSGLEQVLTNLVVNALDSGSPGGWVEIGLTRERLTHPEDVGRAMDVAILEVRDNGSGIASSDRSHIFEPFFTTKEVGCGTGLGLSIAFEIVQDHGGWITLESELGRGSCFRLHLPLRASKEEQCAVAS